MARPGIDPNEQRRYFPTPILDHSESAYELGFHHRVEFPDQNIARYFKIVDIPDEIDNNNKQYTRLCAKAGGVLVNSYDPKISKVCY